MSQLLVIVPDRLSDLIRKGEFAARYYNPGNLFGEVHLLMTNDDQPDLQALQSTVGRAKLFLYNLPAGKELFLKSLMWRPSLLQSWAKAGVALAKKINPQLIRCHANLLNGFLASEIKRELKIPYVMSLHINPDEDVRGRAKGWKEWVASHASESMERISLHNADVVLPVYEPIVPYLRRMGVTRYEVMHNIINPDFIKPKRDYRLHKPVKIISVGRLTPYKYPANLIRAIKGLNAELTVVGDGPAAVELQRVAREAGVADAVTFISSIPNDELCSVLPEYDMFATHSEYFEISKSVLEPLLTGLPTILNRRIGAPVPELRGDFLILVDNTVAGYRSAIERLLSDDAFRESLGRKAFAHARGHWAPDKMEAKFVQIYKQVMQKSHE